MGALTCAQVQCRGPGSPSAPAGPRGGACPSPRAGGSLPQDALPRRSRAPRGLAVWAAWRRLQLGQGLSRAGRSVKLSSVEARQPGQASVAMGEAWARGAAGDTEGPREVAWSPIPRACCVPTAHLPGCPGGTALGRPSTQRGDRVGEGPPAPEGPAPRPGSPARQLAGRAGFASAQLSDRWTLPESGPRGAGGPQSPSPGLGLGCSRKPEALGKRPGVCWGR